MYFLNVYCIRKIKIFILHLREREITVQNIV